MCTTTRTSTSCRVRRGPARTPHRSFIRCTAPRVPRPRRRKRRHRRREGLAAAPALPGTACSSAAHERHSPRLSPGRVALALASGHTDRVTCIAMTKDGKYLASGQITHMGYLAPVRACHGTHLSLGLSLSPVLAGPETGPHTTGARPWRRPAGLPQLSPARRPGPGPHQPTASRRCPRLSPVR